MSYKDCNYWSDKEKKCILGHERCGKSAKMSGKCDGWIYDRHADGYDLPNYEEEEEEEEE